MLFVLRRFDILLLLCNLRFRVLDFPFLLLQSSFLTLYATLALLNVGFLIFTSLFLLFHFIPVLSQFIKYALIIGEHFGDHIHPIHQIVQAFGFKQQFQVGRVAVHIHGSHSICIELLLFLGFFNGLIQFCLKLVQIFPGVRQVVLCDCQLLLFGGELALCLVQLVFHCGQFLLFFLQALINLLQLILHAVLLIPDLIQILFAICNVLMYIVQLSLLFGYTGSKGRCCHGHYKNNSQKWNKEFFSHRITPSWILNKCDKSIKIHLLSCHYTISYIICIV